MAQSPSHKFGQIIGDLLEASIRAPLEDIARTHGLYLDHKHPRLARGGKSKVSWRDHRGNEHDLDYVLEEGGSENMRRRPRAFIEIAWRRYTKHSRNKAQEIQGAVGPLAETYSDAHPFLGVVLAGVFTEGSLSQLRSHGFEIVYCPYESVVKAFASVGIDVYYDEETPDREVQAKVDAYESLRATDKRRVAAKLRTMHKSDLSTFLDALQRSLNRKVKTVYVIPLHGNPAELRTLDEAIAFLERYDESQLVSRFAKYEVVVRYTNGDQVRGEFHAKGAATDFLRAMT